VEVEVEVDEQEGTNLALLRGGDWREEEVVGASTLQQKSNTITKNKIWVAQSWSLDARSRSRLQNHCSTRSWAPSCE
jgi:hypothetical protein